MTYYDRTDINEGIDLSEVTTVKTAWYVIIGFLMMYLSFKILYPLVIMVLMLRVNISDIAIFTTKNVDYHYIIRNIGRFEAINILENAVLEDRVYMWKNIVLNFSRFKPHFFFFKFFLLRKNGWYHGHL